MHSTAIKKFLVIIKYGLILYVGAILFGMLLGMSAHAVTLNVVDNDGVAITDFRWVLEEDTTRDSIPGATADGSNLSLSFHSSYMPVIAKGTTSAELDALTLDSNKRYYISVMPGRTMTNAIGQPTHQLGGAQIGKGQTEVTVRLIKGAVPTAQISALYSKTTSQSMVRLIFLRNRVLVGLA